MLHGDITLKPTGVIKIGRSSLFASISENKQILAFCIYLRLRFSIGLGLGRMFVEYQPFHVSAVGYQFN